MDRRNVLRIFASGSAWSSVTQWACQALQIAVTIILARILAPNDYGIVGMSATFTGFVSVLGNLGLGPALISQKDIDGSYIKTALAASFVFSFVLYSACFIFAPFVAIFYQQQLLTSIIRVSALSFIIAPYSAIVSSLLLKSLRLRLLSLIEFLSTVTGLCASLAFAFSGYGLWSLILGNLTATFLKPILLATFSRYPISGHIEMQKLQSLFSYGIHIFGTSILSFAGRNGDNIIVGKMLGSVSLGYYDLAYQIMMRPIVNVANTLTRPLFPMLVKMLHDKQHASEFYRQIVAYLSYITTPIMLGVASVCSDLILAVFGDKWAPAIPLVRILACVGAIQCINSTVGDIYMSHKRTDVMFIFSIIATPIFLVIMYSGALFGLLGLATMYAIANIIYAPISHSVANRIIGLSNLKFFKSLFPSFFASILMALFVVMLRSMTPFVHLDPPIRLAVLSFLGAAFYVSAIIIIPSDDLSSIITRMPFLKSILNKHLIRIYNLKS